MLVQDLLKKKATWDEKLNNDFTKLQDIFRNITLGENGAEIELMH